MSPRRSKDQLIIQILTTCQGDGISKTQIVYRVKINNVNHYLYQLTKKGLLEVIPGKFALYKTTAKGEKTLESLKKVEEIYSRFCILFIQSIM